MASSRSHVGSFGLTPPTPCLESAGEDFLRSGEMGCSGMAYVSSRRRVLLIGGQQKPRVNATGNQMCRIFIVGNLCVRMREQLGPWATI